MQQLVRNRILAEGFNFFNAHVYKTPGPFSWPLEPSDDMSTTSYKNPDTVLAFHKALNKGITSGTFVDTKFILFSGYDSSLMRVCKPKALYANSHVLKSIPYFDHREPTAHNPSCIQLIDLFCRLDSSLWRVFGGGTKGSRS